MIGRTNAGGQATRLTGLAITSPPDKTEYSVGDALDLTGLVVTASYSDGTSQDVTAQCSFSPAAGTILNTNHNRVTITWKGQTLIQSITVTDVHIYGVSWGGTSSSTMTRTDDAATFANPVPYVQGANNYGSPFDNLMPWKGMVKETISGLGTLVKIPKYWYKWTRSGSTMKLQIADKATEGFHVSPAHADRGDGKGERDYVYVGRYHCSANDYKSTSGVQPKASITRATARSGIHNLNANAWQIDYAMFWTINMLYLVEFADWDSQKTIGYGCGSGSKTNSGKTDSMPYHTGTVKSSRTTYDTGIQYRYIEDWWANVFDWVDGIRFSGSDVYVYNKPSDFSDSSGGTKVGTRATSGGYIKTWTNPTASGFEWALYPNGVDENNCQYVCDWCYFGSSGVVLCVGGSYGDSGDGCGAFYMDGSGSASVSNSYIGCRLQYLP